VITALLACITLVLVIFAILGEYSRKERVIGFLNPESGLVRIIPPQSGRIDKIFFKDGWDINKGDKIFSIETDTQNSFGLGIANGLLRQLSFEKAELEKLARLDSLHNDLSKKRLQLQQESNIEEQNRLIKRVLFQEKVVSNEKLVLNKMKSLVDENAMSPIDASIQENKYLEASQVLESLRNEKERLKERALDLENQYSLLEISEQRESSEVKQRLISIEQRIIQTQGQEEYIIESPIEGKVASITANVGQFTSTQRAIATIVPKDSELIAHLLIPSRAAGLLKLGQSIRLQYDAFPYQKFGVHTGIVEDISRSVIAPTDLEIAPRILEPVFLIKVKLNDQSINTRGQTYDLQAGMTLSADIILEKRKIWEWLFSPILAAVNR
jgi:membrane fusion protein